MGKCEKCKYADFTDKATGHGYCKRYPPVMHMIPGQDKFTGQITMQQIVAQPAIRPEQECGEFAVKMVVQ